MGSGGSRRRDGGGRALRVLWADAGRPMHGAATCYEQEQQAAVRDIFSSDKQFLFPTDRVAIY
jgi:hypothetical protein